ncbi:prepilin-type N-terminal cleavage/methylation domain-containing protein (plasmid) [Streptomyces sp. BI20]|uniref:prepilin-type N-terminal cleavage/methylation domain-containing protein n=1 Tax=Streptomyces sp. BI20 TaxID=3403460 RepID=UPI003C756C00
MTPAPRPFLARARGEDGFTLVELLVVIVILGVLAAIVVFSVRGVGDKGSKAAIAADAATLRTAEESYCAKYGRYGTVEDLKTDGLLAGDPAYNMVVVGQENKCGRGEKSSFTLYDTSTPTESVAEGIPVGGDPRDVTVDEKADRAYAVSAADNTLTVIDGKTDTRIGEPVSLAGAVTGPNRVAADPGTGRVYVGGDDGVAIVDTREGNRVTKVDGYSTKVTALSVSPENGDVYVAGGVPSQAAVAYITAGGSTATPIPLPDGGVVGESLGVDFAFDTERHRVYFAKGNVGTADGKLGGAGLYALSTQSHELRLVTYFATKSACGSKGPSALRSGSMRGSVAVDPVRNLVYLLAQRCVPDPAAPAGSWKTVGTTIAVDPDKNTSTAIDDLVGTPYTPNAVVYSPGSGAVHVHSNGGTGCNGSGGRIMRIVGTEAKGQVRGCTIANLGGNLAHKMTMLKKYNRIFVGQEQAEKGAPGGIGAFDAGTLLVHPALGTTRQFGALAVNNTTDKLYAVDPKNGTIAVFRTGPA